MAKPSMYAQYIRERTGDEIIETERGFATYRFLNEGKSIYIIDIFIVSDWRGKYEASRMADIIGAVGKKAGATEMLGTVNPGAKNATDSLAVLIGYGMTLASSTNDMILFRKGL